MNGNAGSVANIGTADVTLATISLPAGSYLLFGKATLVRASGNGTSVCTLYNGLTALDQLTLPGSSVGEVVALHAPLTLAVPGPTALTLACRSVNGSQATLHTASFRVLSAYKLSTLTVQ